MVINETQNIALGSSYYEHTEHILNTIYSKNSTVQSLTRTAHFYMFSNNEAVHHFLSVSSGSFHSPSPTEKPQQQQQQNKQKQTNKTKKKQNTKHYIVL